jgi:hypothetical protein
VGVIVADGEHPHAHDKAMPVWVRECIEKTPF